MGVKGLTTFLQENKHRLSKTIELSADDDTLKSRTALVIDGWSFIYSLNSDISLPWVYGGQYLDFANLITQTVKAWIAVGLTLHFVFDGPLPEAKFATAVSRRNQSQVQSCQLFFRTSSVSRSTTRFLHDIRLLPPLSGSVCTETLRDLANDPEYTDYLFLYFADEEGDSYAVELAGHIGAFIAGQDSDFVIYNIEGYRGYIPLDEMVWVLSSQEDDSQLGHTSDDDFQVVQSKKKKGGARQKALAGRGLIPPSNDVDIGDLTLSIAVYTPDALAQNFDLPVTLLPLLSATVGNDFTLYITDTSSTGFAHPPLFDGRLTHSQRITFSAQTLSSLVKLLSGQTKGKRKQKAPKSVVDLISMTVTSLTANRNYTSYEHDQIVTRIVEATLPYAIRDKPVSDTNDTLSYLWPTDFCALHDPSLCGKFSWLCGSLKDSYRYTEEQRQPVQTLYNRAYQAGHFNRQLTDVLSSNTFWPKLFLENPDVENVGRTIGRDIRVLVYALLDDGLGLSRPKSDDQPLPDEPKVEEEEENDPNEIIDVAEDSDDSFGSEDMATWRTNYSELRARVSDNVDDVNEVSNQDLLAALNKLASNVEQATASVTEYVRKGSRVVGEEIEVSSLQSVFQANTNIKVDISTLLDEDRPVQLHPADIRFTICLQYLGSDIPSVRKLPPRRLMAVLSMRWVVRCLHKRSVSGSKERMQERWTKREARAFLSSFTYPDDNDDGSAEQPQTEPNLDSSTDAVSERTPIIDRNVQLTAQISMAMECIEHLAETLLITDLIPHTAGYFSGEHFHAYLSKTREISLTLLHPDVWTAATEELDECFASEHTNGRKAKKAKSGSGSAQSAVKGEVKNKGKKAGLFDILAEINH